MKIWNRLDNTTRLSIACIGLYLLLYLVTDIAETIGAAIAMWIM